MKKLTMIAGALSIALFSAPAKAHSGDMCNFNMDYDLSIHNAEITFENESGKVIRINDNNQLFVNGTAKELNTSQQALVDNYADGVRDLIPEITSIAVEGVNLGVSAAGMALGALLGEGDPDYMDFTYRINGLAESITSRLNANQFSTKDLEEAFGGDFEREIEQVVEEAVTELTPRIMAKIATAALSGDSSNFSDIEQRAQSIEQEVENFVEPQVAALEERANELCGHVEALDSIEDQMVEAGLDMMDLIEKDSSDHSHKNKKHFDFSFSD